jgi:hypothetical protein
MLLSYRLGVVATCAFGALVACGASSGGAGEGEPGAEATGSTAAALKIGHETASPALVGGGGVLGPIGAACSPCPIGEAGTIRLHEISCSQVPVGQLCPEIVKYCDCELTGPSAPPPLSAWSQMVGSWPVDANIILLTDGTLLGFSSDGTVYGLAPDGSGAYAASTWAARAPMHDSRLYFGTNVLPDGRVMVVGGEYGTGTNKGEVYDPVANTWTTPFSTGAVDTETALLPDGTVYIAWSSTIYNPATDSVSAGPLYPGQFDEASFVLLPDQSFLTVPAFSPIAYRYVPSAAAFVPAGAIPSGGLFDVKQEVGPGILLPNGKVFWIGGNGKTALYTPPSGPSDPGSWVAGPPIPDGYNADDAPAVMLRNGTVLFLADVGGSQYTGPTSMYVYDPVSNLMSPGTPAFDGPVFTARLLPLPNGQVLLSTGGEGYLYTPPAGGSAWAPAITGIGQDSGAAAGVYTLSGTNLHGLSEGAAYGDDAEMSSNYPLVRFECAGGAVSYGRTFGWAPAVVGVGPAIQSTQFSVPSGASGACSLVVEANGIPSAGVPVTVANGGLSF